MTGALVITVWFADGRYHGEQDGFADRHGWPPAPARLFQALVAGATRGATLRVEDEDALRWLEGLQAPKVIAPVGRRGGAARLFVPNNDLDSVGGDPARIAEIRIGKLWRPVLFDSSEPVLYVWRVDEAASAEARQVCGIAERLYQLGRGIDVAWARGELVDEGDESLLLASHSGVVRRPGGFGGVPVPCPGTFRSLERRQVGRRRRLRLERSDRKVKQLFVQPPKALFRRIGYEAQPHRLCFELRREEGGFAPWPLASAAPLISGLLATATRKLQDALPQRAAAFERLIRGRGAGPEDLAQRVRLVPIPSVGSPHVDRAIRRVLLEIPTECPIRSGDIEWGFAGLGHGQPAAGPVGSASRLVSSADTRMAKRFAVPSRIFRSVTPVALSEAPRRRVDKTGSKSVAEREHEERRAVFCVLQSLRRVGVDDRPVTVRLQKEPFHRRGTRADQFAEGTRFSKHALWHLELEFAEALTGPLLLGDGRFCGLGLMEPVRREVDTFAFDLGRAGGVDVRERAALIRHLRRALMALARDSGGEVGRLFSGHETGGQAARSGHHEHLFLAADGFGSGSVERLLVIAPWAVDRRASRRWGDVERFNDVTRSLRELRSGSAGRFRRLLAVPVTEGDPLLGPSRTWIGQTDYVATRNLKRRDDAEAMIRADLTAECRRRGLPKPAEVSFRRMVAGPRGGRPAARLELRFAVAVRGPVLLGRDSHSGGGLFHAAKAET